MAKRTRKHYRIDQLPVSHHMMHRAVSQVRERAKENDWNEGASLGDAALLAHFFCLDPDTGRLLHRVPDRRFFKSRGFSVERAQRQDGTAADTVIVGGQYRRVNLLRQPIAAHLVVYVLAFGEVPVGCYVDHIDLDGLNNRPANLVARTPAEAWRAYRGSWGDVTAGSRPGVRFRAGMWEAAIFELVADAFGGLRRSWRKLGRYVTQEQAVRAYDAAEGVRERDKIASLEPEISGPGFNRWLADHKAETRLENERLRLAGITPGIDA